MGAPGNFPGLLDAEITRVSNPPRRLQQGVEYGVRSVATRNQVWIDVPKVGRFLITAGKRVEYYLHDTTAREDLDLYLHGPVRAAILYQRGFVVLRAAVLQSPDLQATIALSGQSGAGKSTLAMALVRKGWSLLDDDFAACRITDGLVTVYPGRPDLKLWQDTCTAFGLDTENLPRLRCGLNKYFVPVARSDRPSTLTHVFALQRSEATACGAPDRLSLGGKFAALSANSANHQQMVAMGGQQNTHRVFTSIVQNARICGMPVSREVAPQKIVACLERAL